MNKLTPIPQHVARNLLALQSERDLLRAINAELVGTLEAIKNTTISATLDELHTRKPFDPQRIILDIFRLATLAIEKATK